MRTFLYGPGFGSCCREKGYRADRIGFPGPGDKTVAEQVAKANPGVKYDKMEGYILTEATSLPQMINFL
jgi:hypothetical protein